MRAIARSATCGGRHHFAAQESGEQGIFFRHVLANGEHSSLFAADCDLIPHDELAECSMFGPRLQRRSDSLFGEYLLRTFDARKRVGLTVFTTKGTKVL